MRSTISVEQHLPQARRVADERVGETLVELEAQLEPLLGRDDRDGV
jgi:hypothetical protein